MTGNELLHTIQRERLEQVIKIYCCPKGINVETQYSENIEKCNNSCQGDCEECWNSKITNC